MFPVWRELANGIWFFLDVEICITLIVFTWRRRARGWSDNPTIQVAVSLLVYTAGQAFSRGWQWIIGLLENAGHRITADQDLFFVVVLTAGLSIVGALMTVRVFTKHAWGIGFWLALSTIAVAIPLIAHWWIES